MDGKKNGPLRSVHWRIGQYRHLMFDLPLLTILILGIQSSIVPLGVYGTVTLVILVAVRFMEVITTPLPALATAKGAETIAKPQRSY